MTILLGIIVSILMFSLIVLFHEFGHFKSARIFGVKVEEFGLGIPPRAKRLFTDKKGTLFSLNWLPLGGFVKLKGEQIHHFILYDKKGKLLSQAEVLKRIEKKQALYNKDGELLGSSEIQEVSMRIETNKDPDNLVNKPYWQQSIIILGGVGMNFLLAIIIFSILFFVGVKPIGINTKIETSLTPKLIPSYEEAIEYGLLQRNSGVTLHPLEKSIAENAGIKSGDIVLKIDSEKINDTHDLIKVLGTHKNQEILFEIIREEKNIEILVVPSIEGKIGSAISDNIKINENFQFKYPLHTAILMGMKETYNQSLLTLLGIKHLFINIIAPEKEEDRKEAIDGMAGPIGIVSLVTGAMAGGVVLIIILSAMISISLGVFNLLPIPALDGGRFLFICINSIFQKTTGKKGISPYIEGSVHIVFFILLIGLSIIVAYNDIQKLIK